MAQTRGLRQRIKSVHSIRQITKTMEMVATSRLKRAQDRVVAAQEGLPGPQRIALTWRIVIGVGDDAAYLAQYMAARA